MDDHLDRIKNLNRLAQQGQDTTDNTMRELGDQGETIKRQIDMVPMHLYSE